MKHTDFLILYENRNRELENICLLKYELERRGYSVTISDSTLNPKQPRKIDANVVVTPWLYHSYGVRFAKRYVRRLNKILNLQWEQIFPPAVEQSTTSRKVNFLGLAKKGCHISWGPNNYQRLIEKNNIPADQVRLTGHLTFDFLRPEMRSYYLSRQVLIEQYQMPAEQKLVLFISSFQFAEYPKELQNKTAQVLDVKEVELIDSARGSQHMILDWFERLLNTDPTITLVYRPHNSEVLSPRVLELEKKSKHFRIIRDHSIKQWILCSDTVLNWTSTSLAEILVAGKDSFILRPYPVPAHLDTSLLKNQDKFIQDETTFLSLFDDELKRENWIINYADSRFDEYYTLFERPTYMLISDYLEEIVQNKKYDIKYLNYIVKIGIIRFGIRQIRLAFDWLLWQFIILFNPFKLGRSSRKALSDKQNRQNNLYDFNRSTVADVDQIIHKIKDSLNQKSEPVIL